MKKNRTILITGSAGFIGFHMTRYLMAKNWKVLGIDGITKNYDVNLKQARHALLSKNKLFTKYEFLLENKEKLLNICLKFKPEIIIHLAAQAGVRYSIENPEIYLRSNVNVTFNILELAKKIKVKHLLFASTSSVYGYNQKLPFVENSNCNRPLSFYASTKIASESMSHAYSYSYGIPISVFRFFTVYGPWGRPDMALHRFTESILNDKMINVYNHGKMKRDFTYIDDLVKGAYFLIDTIPKKPSQKRKTFNNDSLSEVAPWRVVNIGNAESIKLLDFVTEIENALGKKAKKNFVKMQIGDVSETWSNIELLESLTGFTPKTKLSDGIKTFVNWYKNYYQ